MDVRSFATAWSVETSRLAWLLGAGASAAAGLPTASMIRDDMFFRMYARDHGMAVDGLDQTDPDTLARVRGYFDGVRGFPPLGSATDYSAAVMAAMPEEETRRRYLQTQLQGGTPSYGQRVLGSLVATGGADVLVTTNFDDLIETAVMDARVGCGVTGAQRSLKAHGLLATGPAATVLADAAWPLLLKLHGDFREGRELKNTEPELRQQDAAMLQLVSDLSRTHGLVVAGYSGRDTSVMTMLINSCRIPNAWPAGIWWLVRDGANVPDLVSQLMGVAASNGITARLVTAGPFDEVMGHLADQVSLDASVRKYLGDLRPKGRLLPSTPSYGAGNAWPILRFNALPIRDVQITAASVPLARAGTFNEVREAIQESRWYGPWAIGAGTVLAIGDTERLASVVGEGTTAGGPPSTTKIELSPSLPGFHQSILLQAIASSWTKTLPFKVRTQRGRVSLHATPERSDESESRRSARARLVESYGGPLAGRHQASMGLNRDGEARYWAERLTLRMAYESDRWWVVFQPSTWSQRLEDANRIDPAIAWNQDRWATRKRNEYWAELIATWSEILCPEKHTTLTVGPLSFGGETHRNLVVMDKRSAYSRSAS